MPDPRPSRRYRFGTFEAESTTGELRRQGIRVKLNAQSFQVLLMLLDRPGELLTRQEISRELWPDGTFVDYEHGVNSAVNRIREALGDTASNPRFIETLARRGYRFVAPVERTAVDDPPGHPASESVSSDSREQAAFTIEPETQLLDRFLARSEELPRTSFSIVQTLFVLLQVMYLGFYIGALANLAEIEGLLSGLAKGSELFTVVIVTATLLIPVRVFVLSMAIFHAPGARNKFLKIWPLLLPMDVLWSLSPFLLLHHISFGLALSCTAILVYSPFAQRSLVLMGAGAAQREISATIR